MPSSSELPEDVRALTRRHAAYLSETAWSAQVTQLIDSLEHAIDAAESVDSTSHTTSEGQISPREHLARPPWRVAAHRASSGGRVLQLQSLLGSHELTINERPGHPAGPLVMLDGNEQELTSAKVAPEETLLFGANLTLSTLGATSDGSLVMFTQNGRLRALSLYIDGKNQYEEGAIPRPD